MKTRKPFRKPLRSAINTCAMRLAASALAASTASAFAQFQASPSLKPPTWAVAGKPFKSSEIKPEDYPWLAHWFDANAKPASQYVLDLFASHQVVILGELHNAREHKEFLLKLIPELYRKAGVRAIGWEFSRHGENGQLDKLVTAAAFQREAALDFARAQFFHDWDSKEHWDVIEAVWHLNHSLSAGEEKMRLIGLQGNFDWLRDDLTKIGLAHDREMAAQVEKEILSTDKKGLVFVGRCHDFTHYEFPSSVNMGRPIMGNLLHKKYGERVFQVWLSGGVMPSFFDKVTRVKGKEAVGFALWRSPLAQLLTPGGWDAPNVPFECVARGFVYFGPTRRMHKVTPIPGFVNDDMFARYGQAYKKEFEQGFKNAREVDDYFQRERFPKPQ